MKSVLISLALIGSVLFVVASNSAETRGTTATYKFQYVQVNRFEVQPGVDLPPDYVLTIDEDLNKEMGKIKSLKQVLREGESLPQKQPVLLVTGTITKYKKGNQAARYLVGFGAGATVIGAQIKCYDAVTKELVLESDVDGKVIMGLMGGKSEGANNGLAKEVVKRIKQKFF